MKKLLKIFGYTFAVLLVFTMILVVIASLSQKKIVDVALKKISAATTVPIKIDDLSFTLIKRFPYATFELSGVQIGETGNSNSALAFQSDKDLLSIESVFVLVKSIPLIKGEFEIIKFEIDCATINYGVDTLGCSNFDFLLAGDEASKNTSSVEKADTALYNPFLFDLKEIKITNSALHYLNDSTQMLANVVIPGLKISGKIIDTQFSGSVEGDLQLENQNLCDSSKIAAHVYIPGMELNGKMENNQFSGEINGGLKLTQCVFGNTNLNRMEEATFDLKLGFENDTLDVFALNAFTEGAKMDANGKVAFTENLYSSLVFDATELNLEILKKYVPDNLLKEYKVEKLVGIMNVSGTVKGNLSDSLMPAVQLTYDLKNGNTRVGDYPEIKKIRLKGTFTNGRRKDNKTSSVNFSAVHSETDSSKIDLNFSLNNFDKPNYKINSKLEINVDDFKDLIPDSMIQTVSGKVKAEFTTKGTLPDSIDNNFIRQVLNQTTATATFSDVNIEKDALIVNDFSGAFRYSPGQFEVADLNLLFPLYQIKLMNFLLNAEFIGEFTESQSFGLHFKNFSFETPQGKIQGSGKIINLENPEFEADASAAIYLDELQSFLPDSLLENISGSLMAEVRTFGKLHPDSITNQLTDIVFKQSRISLDAQNISFTLADNHQTLTNFYGNAKMEHDTISITKMSGVAAGVDFSIDSVTVLNGYKTLVKNRKETLFARGNIELGAIDYSNFDWLFTTDSVQNATISTDAKTENTTRNFSYEFKGKIAAKSLTYNKIFLEDCSAKFKMSDSVYIVDQFKAKAFDGSTNSSLRMSVTEDGKQIVNVKNQVDRMNLRKFMFAFDNFGQDSLISYENVSGLFSTIIHSRFIFENDSLLTNDARVMGDLTLENGRIINYLPAMEVGQFTGIKELDNIELKTVKSNIFFFKSHLYIPTTDVVSSSMDFSAFGMQSLGDDYEYHLEMHLRDALKGKSKKLFERQKKSGDEITQEDLARNTVKIIYSYIDGKQKTGFDTKKAQKTMVLKIQVQQKMLELIFHPQLVSFDTGVK